jgi:hypothetical protein
VAAISRLAVVTAGRLAVLTAICIPVAASPTFYRDVLPVLQTRCQECHRAGQMAPMPLTTYQEVRPWAKSIRQMVRSKTMPPWFADPCCGKFSNDRSLTQAEIDAIAQWVDAGSPAGDPKSAPAAPTWPSTWNLGTPDATFEIPKPFHVPAKGPVDYQRFVVPLGFQEDRWIQAVEVRPGARAVVHHVVVYIRERGETWVTGFTKADILQVYAPGTAPEIWPEGMAKLIPAGADLIFEIHYTPNGKPAVDQTRVALIFSKAAPAKRVLTLQMSNDRFEIAPGEPNYRVTAWGTLPNDALLLSFFPHMHLRGKSFEFTRIQDNGQPQTLLRVPHYNFYWQLSYRLAEPMPLKKGARLEWIAVFDNSPNNPRNPDPSAEVHYGEQSDSEMMIGFFDVAVDAGVDKNRFFVR